MDGDITDKLVLKSPEIDRLPKIGVDGASAILILAPTTDTLIVYGFTSEPPIDMAIPQIHTVNSLVHNLPSPYPGEVPLSNVRDRHILPVFKGFLDYSLEELLHSEWSIPSNASVLKHPNLPGYFMICEPIRIADHMSGDPREVLNSNISHGDMFFLIPGVAMVAETLKLPPIAQFSVVAKIINGRIIY